MKTQIKNKEVVLTQAQFDARQAAGTLEPGITYKIIGTPQEKITTENKLDYGLIDNTPTKLSQFENDGDGTANSHFATEDYVDTHGGKIDEIQINGTPQTITNKVVNLPAYPTRSSLEIDQVNNTSDVNKPISTATQQALDAKQATLVSGTNIKTINNQDITGSGNLTLQESTITFVDWS